MSVVVFVFKEAFDLPCLPQHYKDDIEISELVEFSNKRLTEIFFFSAKRSLMKTFFRSSKRKFRMILWRIVKKGVDCMGN